MPNKTRKNIKLSKNKTLKSNKFSLIELKKSIYSRFKEVKTYLYNCKRGQLSFIQTIDRKPTREISDALQIVKGIFKEYHKPVVIKVYEHSSKMSYLISELKMYSLLKRAHYKHVILPLCVFHCNDYIEKYNTDIINYQFPCNNNGKSLIQFVIFDYIPTGNISNFIKINHITNNRRNIIKSVIIQYILVVFDLAVNHNIYHGDLNSGNILIKKTDNTSNHFNINSHKFDISCYGFSPVLIDFGRSRISINQTYYNIIFDISITLTAIIKDLLFMNGDGLLLILQNFAESNSFDLTNLVNNISDWFDSLIFIDNKNLYAIEH